jgi:hypothetical protein
MKFVVFVLHLKNLIYLGPVFVKLVAELDFILQIYDKLLLVQFDGLSI